MHLCVYFPSLMEDRNTDADNVVASYQLYTLLFRDSHAIPVVLFVHGRILLFLVVQVASCYSQMIQRAKCKLTSLD